MSDTYYGIYLIPPPPIVVALSLAHRVMAQEFGTVTANGFMVHATIKGFCKLADGTTPEAVVPALDDLFARTPAFPAEINPPWTASSGPGSGSVLLWITKTPAIQALHEAVWDIVIPHVAPDCRFTPTEPAGPNFPPHLTLVQSDLPTEPGLAAQGLALSRYLYDQMPAHAFLAQELQLIEFHSDDWAGAWGATLRYRQLKGWHLREEANG
jgi:hypothetical protein